jgi:hypothetical protein
VVFVVCTSTYGAVVVKCSDVRIVIPVTRSFSLAIFKNCFSQNTTASLWDPNMCTFTWCTCNMVHELAWWRLYEPEHVATFIIDNKAAVFWLKQLLNIYRNTTGWLQLQTNQLSSSKTLCIWRLYEGGPKYCRNLILPHKRDIVQGSATRYGEPTIFWTSLPSDIALRASCWFFWYFF